MEERHNLSGAEQFYVEVIQVLKKYNFPFLIGGTFGLTFYTGIRRETKDLDLFLKAHGYQHILRRFVEEGYKVEITDVRWLAKIFKGDYFVDIIFNTVNNLCPVEDSWFEYAVDGELFKEVVKFVLLKT